MGQAQLYNIELHLVGAYEGQTRILKRRQFVNGVLAFTVPKLDAVEGMITFYQRSYQVKVVINGVLQNDPSAQPGNPESVQGGDGSPGATPSPEAATGGAGDAGTGAGAPGVRANGEGGSGATAPGVGAGAEAPAKPHAGLKDALTRLDLDNDDHWTQTGEPAISAVAEISGIAGLKRADIKDAAPNLTREALRDA